jgi:hypothetical protein
MMGVSPGVGLLRAALLREACFAGLGWAYLLSNDWRGGDGWLAGRQHSRPLRWLFFGLSSTAQ